MNNEWQSLQPQTQQELKNTMNAMQPPQSIEEIKAGLETTEKGGVRQSIRNCLTVFQRDPLLSGAIAYNILTDRKDIIKPIGFHRESTALNDTDMKYLLLYLEEIAELKVPLTEVQEDLKKLRDIRYWVRKATPGTEESKESPKKQPIKEVLQDKADEKKAQRTAPAQAKHRQQDMEL